MIVACQVMDPGSIPGERIFFVSTGVAGVMVSIAAFQAVDPGSIPGPRKFFSQAQKNKLEKRIGAEV
jgi:hypothetical protein